MIYLATPYSDPDPAVREYRFRQVNKAAAKLISQGYHVFSPISQTHSIAAEGDLPKDWKYWEKYDRKMLGCCDRFMVLKLDGWVESVGVNAEMKIAIQIGMAVEYMDPVKETE